MKKTLLCLAVLLATVPAAGGAHAETPYTPISFHAPIPCMAVCSYWDVPTRLGYTPCEYPFPEGGYADVVVRAPAMPPGKSHLVLEFEIYPALDYDAFICDKPATGNNGMQLATGANQVGEACSGILGPNDVSGTGCPEHASTPAVPGHSYVLRAYNWQDFPDCPGAYRFIAL
jgi:hypothetical protein